MCFCSTPAKRCVADWSNVVTCNRCVCFETSTRNSAKLEADSIAVGRLRNFARRSAIFNWAIDICYRAEAMSAEYARAVALKVLLFIFIGTLIFHFFIILGFIPSTIIWGGRIETVAQFYILESISIVLNFAFLVLTLWMSKSMKTPFSEVVVRRAFYVVGLIFLLNTLGNLLSDNLFERTFFTGLTLLISALSFLVARKT